MTDNIKVKPSLSDQGVQVATDDIGGTHYPIYKHAFGAEDSVALVSDANPLPVTATLSVDPIEIARGNVTGYSRVNKFGQNAALNSSTYEDLWDGGGTYTYPTDGTAPITHIDSSSASDTEDIEVQGLDINGTLTVQTITLTGTTIAALTTPLWRCFRLKNVGSVDLVGTAQAVNAADTVIYAQIAIGNNQTLMALYTIPLGKTGALIRMQVSMDGTNRAVAASGRIRARAYGGVFQLKSTFGADSDGGSHTEEYPYPDTFAALTDIRADAIGSTNTISINCRFTILLIDD